jgi:hypothetical protein
MALGSNKAKLVILSHLANGTNSDTKHFANFEAFFTAKFIKKREMRKIKIKNELLINYSL